MRSGAAVGERLSVVIPARNEARILHRCLDALVAQGAGVDEIVVVDNGSSDDTAAIARSYPEVRLISEPQPGIAAARSAGFDAASGTILARIDADSIVAPGWAAAIRDAFAARPELDGIGGGAAIAELSPGDRYWFALHYRAFRFWHEHSIGVHSMLYGFNSAIRREAWLRARHLVSREAEGLSEDVDLTIAVLRTGGRLAARPEVLVKARLFRSLAPTKLSGYYRTDDLTLARHDWGNPRRRRRGAAAGLTTVRA